MNESHTENTEKFSDGKTKQTFWFDKKLTERLSFLMQIHAITNKKEAVRHAIVFAALLSERLVQGSQIIIRDTDGKDTEFVFLPFAPLVEMDSE